MHDINEYGEVLRDQSIDLLIVFIQRNTAMRQTIANLRKDVTNVDEDLDIVLIRINDLDMPNILKEFENEVGQLTSDLKNLEMRGQELMDQC